MANLIAYYSRTGQNYVNGGIQNLAKGNTERVAEFIQEAVGGNLFEIKPEEAYPADYYECIDVAKQELNEGARPALADDLDDLSGYDTIFLGYPNWWGTAPMAVFTFLDEHATELAGKRIVPFCTNEGSGMGVSERDLAKACPDSTIARGLSVHGAESARSRETAAAWAKASL